MTEKHDIKDLPIITAEERERMIALLKQPVPRGEMIQELRAINNTLYFIIEHVPGLREAFTTENERRKATTADHQEPKADAQATQ